MRAMTDQLADVPRRRQPSPEALAGREAAALVRELNRQLGLWQASSVKLSTMAARLQASGRFDAAVAEEARTLFGVVSLEARRFESTLSSQPPAVAGHTRVKDTLRSFEMVTGRLRSCLKQLGLAPRSE